MEIKNGNVYYYRSENCFVQVVNCNYDTSKVAVITPNGNTFEVFRGSLTDTITGFHHYGGGKDYVMESDRKNITDSLAMEFLLSIAMHLKSPLYERLDLWCKGYKDEYYAGTIKDMKYRIDKVTVKIDGHQIMIETAHKSCISYYPFKGDDMSKFVIFSMYS